uniref:Retinoic acid-induced protein 1 n=1 Tax=Lygus hesperus TaxID=30085 RepID=A0A0A9ZF44_LYGHE
MMFVTLLALAVLNGASSSQMVWDTQVDPLTLWRMYSSAGFVPEDSLWNMENGGHYIMYVPGISLHVLHKYQKGTLGEKMERNARKERHTLQNRLSNLKASFTNKYMGQLNRILQKYYNIPDPEPLLKIFSQFSY